MATPLTDAIDLEQVNRALVVKLRHHGDVLLTTPLLNVLKNRAPHSEIDALVYHDTREMLTLHPALTYVYTVDRAWKNQPPWARVRREWELLRTLRARRYDLLIHLTESYRGAWLSQLLTPRYSVAQNYPRRRGRMWRASFTHMYPVPAKPRHRVEIHLDALRRLGIYPAADERRLLLVPGDDAESMVDALLAQVGLQRGEFVHLHPTSRWLFKCWEIDKYAALIEGLHARGLHVVVTAAPSDHELQFVRALLGAVRVPIVDLAGKLTLKQLAALTARARLFIGVDSVPMHIASAMQTPVVVLFGPSGELEWGPWQVRARVVTLDYSCRPCGLDGCGGSKVSECLTEISVEQVLRAVSEMTSAA